MGNRQPRAGTRAARGGCDQLQCAAQVESLAHCHLEQGTPIAAALYCPTLPATFESRIGGMVMAKRSFNWMHAALGLAALASVALAAPPGAAPPNPQAQPLQQAQQPQAQQRFAQPGQQGQRVIANRPVEGAMNTDRIIAEWLGIANQEEIALANLAIAKVENKKVRDFAEMLVKDHDNLLAQLQKFGAQTARLDAGGRGNPDQAERNQNAQPNRNLPDQPVRDTAQAPRNPNDLRSERTGRIDAPVQGAAPGHFDFLAIKRQIAQRCIASAEKAMSEHKAAERDMAFVGQQIAAHHQMLDTAQVLREHASPALQAVIDKAIEGTQMHLDHAKELIRTLDRAHESEKSDKNS
jgi:predicted outer membrane protein